MFHARDDRKLLRGGNDRYTEEDCELVKTHLDSLASHCRISHMKCNLVRMMLLLAGIVASSNAQSQCVGKVAKLDAALDGIAPAGAKIEKLAGGFGFTEGPVWIKDGYLLFSDVPNNVINKWTPDGKVTVFRKPSGYDGTDAPAGAFI